MGGFNYSELAKRLGSEADIFISAAQLEAANNSAPVLGISGSSRAKMWGLPDVIISGIATIVRVPADWTTLKWEVLYQPSGASASNVFVQAYAWNAGVGQNLTNPDIVAQHAAAFAAGAVEVAALRTLAAVYTVPASKQIGLWMLRSGSDAADTYVGDLLIAGFLLTKL